MRIIHHHGWRNARGPKHIANAATHQPTRASIFIASCTSEDGPLHRRTVFAKAATASSSKAIPALRPDDGASEVHSRKIIAALSGMMRSIWVYASSCKANTKVDLRGPNQMAREIATRTEKTRSGDNLRIDSWLAELDTISVSFRITIIFPSPARRKVGRIFLERQPRSSPGLESERAPSLK